jgi:hypothetical protein
MERKLSGDREFFCILEGDKEKIIDNFEKQIGLSANLEDFSKLACSNNVSTFIYWDVASIIKYLFDCFCLFASLSIGFCCCIQIKGF